MNNMQRVIELSHRIFDSSVSRVDTLFDMGYELKRLIGVTVTTMATPTTTTRATRTVELFSDCTPYVQTE